MKHVICPVCGNICIKYGRNKSGSQRWIYRLYLNVTTPIIWLDSSGKEYSFTDEIIKNTLKKIRNAYIWS